MNQEARFSRMEPELRKANLIEATLVCLKRHGFRVRRSARSPPRPVSRWG
jgi:DNA-binding transcriptional regulator YbjK